jgi:hypothetical protein
MTMGEQSERAPAKPRDRPLWTAVKLYLWGFVRRGNERYKLRSYRGGLF